MEESDRHKIRENIDTLVTIDPEGFNALCKELVDRKVYAQFMLDQATGCSGGAVRHQALNLFLHIRSMGPSAFQQLVEALISTNNISFAKLLKPDVKINVDVNEDEEEGMDEVDASPSPKSETFRRFELNFPSISEEMNNENQADHFAVSKTLKISVTKATKYNNGDEFECYTMKSNPRGFALIINNIEFKEEKRRSGAEHDTIKLKALLEALDFQVTVVENVTKNDMMNTENGVLTKFLHKFNEKTVDCCLVSIMSHGHDKYLIKTSDSQNIDILEDIITTRFNNRNFKAFAKKPKIFLIQACRGSKDNLGVNVPLMPLTQRVQKDCASDTYDCVPEVSDTFVISSTIPGYTSLREETGTWFIDSVCRILMEKAHNRHLADLVSLISKDLALNSDFDYRGDIKQSAHSESFGSFDHLYFNPGL